jgi:gamma-glutamylcyclotransferase (GGCT)/AIG2-like uncharacterized protein YtfP
MKMRLFCYGTLQFPEVMERVSGSHYSAVAAVLDNYVCYTVRDRHYPGIRPEPGANTRGILYQGLGQLQLGRLDAFESDFYQRVRVVVSDAMERPCQAWAYVMRPECHDLLSDQSWDRDWFERLYLRDYLQGIG